MADRDVDIEGRAGRCPGDHGGGRADLESGARLDLYIDNDLVVAYRGSRRADQVDGLGRGTKSNRRGVADQGQPAPLALQWPEVVISGTRPGDGPGGRCGQLRSGTHWAFSCRSSQAATGRAIGSSARLRNMKGRSGRAAAVSVLMVARSALTSGARSVLLMTKRSDSVIPGPPLRGPCPRRLRR